MDIPSVYIADVKWAAALKCRYYGAVYGKDVFGNKEFEALF